MESITTEAKLKLAVDSATAIIFLNQQWLAHLASILEENGLLSETEREFVAHAKVENRKAFDKINQLGKDNAE